MSTFRPSERMYLEAVLWRGGQMLTRATQPFGDATLGNPWNLL
jgi:hypothetical protein